MHLEGVSQPLLRNSIVLHSRYCSTVRVTIFFRTRRVLRLLFVNFYADYIAFLRDAPLVPAFFFSGMAHGTMQATSICALRERLSTRMDSKANDAHGFVSPKSPSDRFGCVIMAPLLLF